MALDKSAVQRGSSVWVLKDFGGNGRISLPVESPGDFKALSGVLLWPVNVTVELKRAVYNVGATQCGRCCQLETGVWGGGVNSLSFVLIYKGKLRLYVKKIMPTKIFEVIIFFNR